MDEVQRMNVIKSPRSARLLVYRRPQLSIFGHMAALTAAGSINTGENTGTGGAGKKP